MKAIYRDKTMLKRSSGCAVDLQTNLHREGRVKWVPTTKYEDKTTKYEEKTTKHEDNLQKKWIFKSLPGEAPSLELWWAPCDSSGRAPV